MMTSLLFTGDIMLGRNVQGNTLVFDNFKEILQEADITVGNLESPLCSLPFISGKKYLFSASEDNASLLKSSGFNVLTLANNHIIDCKEEGIKRTREALDKEGLVYVGLGEGRQEVKIVEVDNRKIGFLAYCKPIYFFKKVKGPYVIDSLIAKDVAKASQEVDFLVVCLHWGEEYEKEPSLKQIELAHSLVDAGADIIVGNHAHHIQKIEEYNGGIIAYCLGNFVFDQQFNEDVKKSILLSINLSDEALEYAILETYASPNHVPNIETSK